MDSILKTNFLTGLTGLLGFFISSHFPEESEMAQSAYGGKKISILK